MKRVYKPVMLLCIITAVVMFFMTSVERLDAGQDGKSREQLERALRKSITISYATYGTYPESLDEIVSRYGIQIEADRFDVFYMPVAENLPPELTIVERGYDG